MMDNRQNGNNEDVVNAINGLKRVSVMPEILIITFLELLMIMAVLFQKLSKH